MAKKKTNSNGMHGCSKLSGGKALQKMVKVPLSIEAFREAPLADATGALLQEVMESFEQTTGLYMNFDDLTGVVQGMHNDVPAMKLDWDHQCHERGFCAFAKRTSQGKKDCIRNKMVSNRLAIRGKQGFTGFCHLGLLDLVEPLIYKERVLGVFYFGSVSVKGNEVFAEYRIRRYCLRRRLDHEPFLRQLKSAMVVEPETIPRLRQALRAVVRLAYHLCETAGINPAIYKFRKLTVPYLDPESLPFVVEKAKAYALAHLDESLSVKTVATYLRCHPDYLSRKFKESTGVNLSDYLNQVRINHAKQLLANPEIEIKHVVLRCGFESPSQFGKLFRRLTGYAPGQYRELMNQQAGSNCPKSSE